MKNKEPTTLESIALMLVKMDGKLDRIEIRLDQVEQRLDRVEQRLDGVQRKLGQVLDGGEDTLHNQAVTRDEVADRLARFEKEFTELKRQVRLLDARS